MPVKNTLSRCNKKGREFTLYYGVGTCATPVWVKHIGLINDLNVTETDGEEELPLRDIDREYKEYVSDKSELAISGEQVVDADYEGYQILRAARGKGTPRLFMFLTGAITSVGETGYSGKWTNFDRSKNGPNTGAASESFNLRPAACTDCIVKNVQVTSANTVSEFDPTTFTPYS